MDQNKDYSIRSTGFQMDDGILDGQNTMYLHDIASDIDHLKQLKFQVDCNNFFANLATMVDLTLQDKEAFKSKRYLKIYKRIRDDLLYLQQNYNIAPK